MAFFRLPNMGSLQGRRFNRQVYFFLEAVCEKDLENFMRGEKNPKMIPKSCINFWKGDIIFTKVGWIWVGNTCVH